MHVIEEYVRNLLPEFNRVGKHGRQAIPGFQVPTGLVALKSLSKKLGPLPAVITAARLMKARRWLCRWPAGNLAGF